LYINKNSAVVINDAYRARKQIMAKKYNKAFEIGNKKYRFNNGSFNSLFKDYYKKQDPDSNGKIASYEEEFGKLIQIDGSIVSGATVHSWRLGDHQPNCTVEDLDNIADILNVDKMCFLQEISYANKEWLCIERFMSVKRISDAIYEYLQLFKKTAGFEKCHTSPATKAQYESYLALVNDEYEASQAYCLECLEKVELVLKQEEFLLKDTKVYKKLTEFFDSLSEWNNTLISNSVHRNCYRSLLLFTVDQYRFSAVKNPEQLNFADVYAMWLAEILDSVGLEQDRKH
jgi:hypothetical protein